MNLFSWLLTSILDLADKIFIELFFTSMELVNVLYVSSIGTHVNDGVNKEGQGKGGGGERYS